jgi:hypothetical protein
VAINQEKGKHWADFEKQIILLEKNKVRVGIIGE